MKKLLPILLFILGSGAGVGAGIFLKPAHTPEENATEESASGEHGTEDAHETGEKPQGAAERPSAEGYDYVKLTNQFVVPIVKKERIASMVVASLSIEVASGYAEQVLAKEPKLRNEFLRVMFDHANVGGFDGAFTEVRNIETLQTALLEVAQKTFGADIISDVLIFEIARQDY